jgi:beta-glucosidase
MPERITILIALISVVPLAGAMADGGGEGEDPPPPFAWETYGITPSENPACIPAPRGTWWPAYHAAMLQREPRQTAKVIFLGDSITMMWRSQSGYEGGTPVWEEHYADLPAANLGISGDRTEHILWRITEGGDLDGCNPELLVLLIGINNHLQRKDSPQQVAEGLASVISYLKRELPETKILLLGIFPCWEQPQNPSRAWVRDTNALLAPMADRKRVWYLDIGHVFVEPDGTISREKLRDLLHLSEAGYRLWAEAMAPYLGDLLSNGGNGDVWDD